MFCSITSESDKTTVSPGHQTVALVVLPHILNPETPTLETPTF